MHSRERLLYFALKHWIFFQYSSTGNGEIFKFKFDTVDLSSLVYTAWAANGSPNSFKQCTLKFFQHALQKVKLWFWHQKG